MHPELRTLAARVEERRIAVEEHQRALKAVVEQTLDLAGVSGLLARLTGSYETQVRAAEVEAQQLRDRLGAAKRDLREAQAALAAGRERVAASEARREQARGQAEAALLARARPEDRAAVAALDAELGALEERMGQLTGLHAAARRLARVIDGGIHELERSQTGRDLAWGVGELAEVASTIAIQRVEAGVLSRYDQVRAEYERQCEALELSWRTQQVTPEGRLALLGTHTRYHSRPWRDLRSLRELKEARAEAEATVAALDGAVQDLRTRARALTDQRTALLGLFARG